MPTRSRLLSGFGRAVVAVIVSLLATAVLAGQVAVKIAPRDQLSINVWNAGASDPAYTVKVPVDADGTFEYPTFGRLKAAGLTARDVEADLKSRLEKILVSPQVTIDVAQTTNKKVIVAGAVRTPGPLPYAGDLTIFEAITRAGSLDEAAGDEAVVHRVSRENGLAQEIRVDLYELVSGRSMRNNIALNDGDTVIIPKSDPVYIYGFVGTPGPVYVKRNTTVLQALSMAGGISDRGSKSRIKIQRMVDGKKKDIQIKNIETDIVQPGDTIVVAARIL